VPKDRHSLRKRGLAPAGVGRPGRHVACPRAAYTEAGGSAAL